MFVDSLDQSTDFYCSLFNLEVKENGVSSKSGRPFRVIGAPDKFYLCLHQAPEGPNKSSGLYNHFGVHVNDFEAFIQKVESLKIPILYGGVIQWPHSKSLYIEGPNQEEIEISENYGGGLD